MKVLKKSWIQNFVNVKMIFGFFSFWHFLLDFLRDGAFRNGVVTPLIIYIEEKNYQIFSTLDKNRIRKAV